MFVVVVLSSLLRSVKTRIHFQQRKDGAFRYMMNADAILIQNANQFPPMLDAAAQADQQFSLKPLPGFSDTVSFHGISSVGGYPALSLPIGFSSPRAGAPRGLPVGVQLIGRRNDEEALIRIGYAYQKKFGVVKVPDLTGGGGSWNYSVFLIAICTVYAYLGMVR